MVYLRRNNSEPEEGGSLDESICLEFCSLFKRLDPQRRLSRRKCSCSGLGISDSHLIRICNLVLVDA